MTDKYFYPDEVVAIALEQETEKVRERTVKMADAAGLSDANREVAIDFALARRRPALERLAATVKVWAENGAVGTLRLNPDGTEA